MSEATNVTVIPATLQPSGTNDIYHQVRVAAYCRVSTELDEQQNSFHTQISYYTEYINKNKAWKLVDIFADEGISGTQIKHRAEFNRMIRMCRRGKIDLILCKSISRFARNTIDTLEYIRELKSMNIGILFEKENINTLTMNSEFIVSLYSSFAQAESESISKNVLWGIEKSFRSGKPRYNFKHIYGYVRIDDHTINIIPEEAEVIRKIYQMYLEGLSMEKIAVQLNDEGISKSKNCPIWKREHIKNILHNEKYVGDCMLQKTYTVDCITHKAVKNNGEKPKYLLTDCHEAIIDRDTYNKTQQEIARRSAKSRKSDRTLTQLGKYSSMYALTEIMVCGECGTSYRRVTWTSGRKRVVWRCISRLDHGKKYCSHSPTYDESKLQAAILSALNDHYGDPESIRHILRSETEALLISVGTDKIKLIERRLMDIDRARSDLIDLITHGAACEDSLDTEFEKLFTEENELKEELEVLRATPSECKEKQAILETALEQIGNAPCELTEYDDIIVRKLINCVTAISKTEIRICFKDGYEMSVNIPDDKKNKI